MMASIFMITSKDFTELRSHARSGIYSIWTHFWQGDKQTFPTSRLISMDGSTPASAVLWLGQSVLECRRQRINGLAMATMKMTRVHFRCLSPQSGRIFLGHKPLNTP